MLISSLFDTNSTSDAFGFNMCFNSFHVGIVVAYVAMSLCFILGTPAHSWLLWFYLRAGWKVKPTQVFPVNLTLLELIYSIQFFLQILNGLFFRSILLWAVICIVFGISCVGRPLMQICICVEQYLAVLHPVMFLKYKGLLYRILFSVLVWLMAAGYSVYVLFTNQFPNPIFNSIFFIAVIVISFCCVSVLRALKHPGPGDTQIPVERGRDVENQQKRNAFNTIFHLLLVILFMYLPQVSLYFVNVHQSDEAFVRCDIAPIMVTFNIWGMITPFMKMYKNGHVKCFKCQNWHELMNGFSG